MKGALSFVYFHAEVVKFFEKIKYTDLNIMILNHSKKSALFMKINK
jgi:hypothetical protein